MISMIFSLINHDFKYELEKVCRLFLPFEKFEFVDYEVCTGNYVLTQIKSDTDKTCLKTAVSADGRYIEKQRETASDVDKREYELIMAQLLYLCLCELTGFQVEWGILTGVRPARLLSNICGEMGKQKGLEFFKTQLFVSDAKAKLCQTCLEHEQEIISRSRSNSFSLYISIPFCPSRCSYCSFVSHSVAAAKKLIPEYVELLCEEIRQTAAIAYDCGLQLQTVYIGGGTPTILEADQLERIMKEIAYNFDLSRVEEYTVEAGRPDTITDKKLIVIRENAATRISINPQTMNDRVLKAIGRGHNSEQTQQAFKMARDLGFNNINMDLIAGLSTDTYESFKGSVDKLIELQPESITVHTLSLKRASNLMKQALFYGIEQGATAAKMQEYSRIRLSEAGLVPYYMYRQGKTVGNLENVGYARPGFEGIYNVYIMDETHTILACGASAVTKLRQPNGDKIERIFNYKYPYEYISGFDEMIRRKKKIKTFYEKYHK